jgi:uncharacterized protein (TIGR02594 family)
MRVLRALAVVFACIMAAPMAQAAHRHHHYHHHHYHHHHVAHRYPARPSFQGRVAHSSILRDAQRYIGMGNPTGFNGPWCAAFTNMVLKQTGHFITGSLRAVDALLLGPHVSHPQPGDIVVLRFGYHRGASHVTFFSSYGGRGFIGLGGNQHHRVKYSSFPLRDVVAFVRPRVG